MPTIIYTHTENMLKKYNYVIKIHKIIHIKKKYIYIAEYGK